MKAITKLGFLGAGTVGCHHAMAATELGAEVVAACTRLPEAPNWDKFKQHAPRSRHLDNGEAILNDPETDAVIACVSWDDMPDWAERLLRCPKPVLIKKPIGLTAAPLRAL